MPGECRWVGTYDTHVTQHFLNSFHHAAKYEQLKQYFMNTRLWTICYRIAFEQHELNNEKQIHKNHTNNQ